MTAWSFARARWLNAVSGARRRGRGQGLGDRLAKAAALIGARTPEARYLATCGFWNPGEAAPAAAGTLPWPGSTGDAESDLLLFDQAGYLPGDILPKVDRATMAASLESRAPFLARPVIDAAWRIAPALRIGGGRGKRILRELLERRVPAELVDRPKTGFSLPLAEWLRGPLREWAESLLTPEKLLRDGLLQPEPIVAAWQAHLSGRRDAQYRLWIVLQFQAWREHQRQP
jgi:asparagine synthase (glutamine-hydrolysing)